MRIITIKTILYLGLLLLPLTAFGERYCDEKKKGDLYKSGLEIVDGEDSIRTNSPLFPGGKIECIMEADYFKPVVNKISRTEKGNFKGVRYKIWYSDGSGTIQGQPEGSLDYTSQDKNWTIACKVDGMDDSHWCYISKEGLMVGIYKDGKSFVSIGHEHYPGSNVTIRIDKLKPITAPEKSGFSEQSTKIIIDQLSSGSSALSRYQKWPYQSNKDETIDLFGFTQAWEILNKVYKSI